MTDKQKETLYELLDQFFDQFDWDKRNAIPRNKIAKLIKDRLKEANRWKDKPRAKEEKVIAPF